MKPVPDLDQTEAAVAKPATRGGALSILAILAILYTLYFARAFFIPIAFSLLLTLLLSPAVRALSRWKISPPLGAALVLAALVAALGGAAYGLSGPAEQLTKTAPTSLGRASAKIRSIVRPVQQVTNNVERATQTTDTPATTKPLLVDTTPSAAARAVGTGQVIAAAILEIIVLVYFLLAGGDLFLQKLVKVLPHFSDKKKAIAIARTTESAVSAYLSTALLVNLTEGVVITGLFWVLGMPVPPLWGAIAACLEFIPYLGALAGIAISTVVALTTFDSVEHAFLVPASYLVVNVLQAYVVTPLLLGRRLTLNPVAIFVGLIFFFWLWGVSGAFLSVPLLATFKIFCDNIDSLAAVGEFLGERDEGERKTLVR
jgi:predicted PurR-regulated permease PerM